MSDAEPDRISVSLVDGRIGVSILIGEVVVTVAGAAPADAGGWNEARLRAAALRLAARALDVARQEVGQEQVEA